MYQNQKHRYCQEINEAMGFDEDFERLSPDLLVPNPSEKMAVKQLINWVIGTVGKKGQYLVQ